MPHSHTTRPAPTTRSAAAGESALRTANPVTGDDALVLASTPFVALDTFLDGVRRLPHVMDQERGVSLALRTDADHAAAVAFFRAGKALLTAIDTHYWQAETWLKQKGAVESIIKLFNNRLFQVYVSTIQDSFGVMIGSTALIRDVTEEKRLEEELRRLSTTDALTGLHNRRHMDYVLTSEHSRSRRTQAPFAVLMFDIDHFKKFNDTYGHEQGDRVLQAVAKTFRDSLRKYDTACRYGGEEFIGILPQTNMDGGTAVAERIRTDVENMLVDGLKVTISIGVAAYPEIPVESTDLLVHAADKALYCSKEHGRNRVTRADRVD